MKLFFQIIFKIFLILIILAGYASTAEIKETDLDELLNQGIVLLEGFRYDRAIAYFNKAIEINPNFAEAYYNRGIAYFGKYQDDKAIADFTEAIEINPRLADAYNNRGFAYIQKDQYDKACSDWNRACDLGLCKDYKWAQREGVCLKTSGH
jgi:tetratricopeptide (TPR) repeat protein